MKSGCYFWKQILPMLAALSLVGQGTTLGGLISQDDPTFGVGAITLDMDTGLQWLDPVLTIMGPGPQLSFNEFTATQLGPSQPFDGFRYATRVEAVAFATHGGLTIGPPDGFGDIIDNIPERSAAVSFVELVGITATGVLSDNIQVGGILSGPPTDVASFYIIANVTPDPDFPDDEQAFVFSLANIAPDGGSSGTTFGHWLVRRGDIGGVVPEPTSFAIFGFGSVSMFAIGRRRRQKP